MNPDESVQKQSSWHIAREWTQTIIIALIIALPIRYFVAEPFIVSGASMDPTFASGQFLVVDRLSYRIGEPKRNDVIVFKYPNNPSIYYIKRIIGLPDDIISVIDGIITITNEENPDGFVLNQSYLASGHIAHDTFTIRLKPSEYFVMGDNRTQSSDSRVWGTLDRNLIVGRPFLRLLPITTISFWPGEYSNDH